MAWALDDVEVHHAGEFRLVGFDQFLLPFFAVLVFEDVLIVLPEDIVAVGVVPAGNVVSRFDLWYFGFKVVFGLPFELVEQVEPYHEEEGRAVCSQR